MKNMKLNYVKNQHKMKQVKKERKRALGIGACTRKESLENPSILAWRIPWTEEPCGLQSVHGVEWTEGTKLACMQGLSATCW